MFLAVRPGGDECVSRVRATRRFRASDCGGKPTAASPPDTARGKARTAVVNDAGGGRRVESEKRLRVREAQKQEARWYLH